MTTTIAGPAATTPPAPVRRCSICPPIVPRASWRDVCECGETRSQHKELTHAGISIEPGVTCFGQNLAGDCRRCTCPRFRLKEKA